MIVLENVAGDAEVELDAARAPWSAQGDVAELDDVVVVEERLAARLVLRAPHLAADLR